MNEIHGGVARLDGEQSGIRGTLGKLRRLLERERRRFVVRCGERRRWWSVVPVVVFAFHAVGRCGAEVSPTGANHAIHGAASDTGLLLGDRVDWSLGNILQSQPTIVKRFAFRNATGKTVVITGTNTSCGCISVRVLPGADTGKVDVKSPGGLPYTVPPNEKAVIEVSLNPVVFGPGVSSGYVFLSDNSGKPVTQIDVHLKARSWIVVEPASLVMRVLPGDRAPSARFWVEYDPRIARLGFRPAFGDASARCVVRSIGATTADGAWGRLRQRFEVRLTSERTLDVGGSDLTLTRQCLEAVPEALRSWSYGATVVVVAAPTATVNSGNVPKEAPGSVAPRGIADSDGRMGAKCQLNHTVCDLGTVLAGSTVLASFQLRNTGNAPLQVQAKAGCGCATLDYDRVVAPGATGKLNVTVHADAVPGRMAKTVEIRTNDPDHADFSVAIKATLVPRVAVVPPNTDEIPMTAGKTAERRLRVRLVSDTVASGRSITTAAPYVSAAIEPVSSDASNHDYWLSVRVSPEAPLGRTDVSLAIPVGDGVETASLSLTLQKGIVPTPARVWLGVCSPEAMPPASATLSLKKADGGVRVRSAHVDDPHVSVHWANLPDAHMAQISLTYKGGWKPGGIKRKLTIETHDPAQPVIVIPVEAQVAEGAAG